jgi:hypothetical protein
MSPLPVAVIQSKGRNEQFPFVKQQAVQMPAVALSRSVPLADDVPTRRDPKHPIRGGRHYDEMLSVPADIMRIHDPIQPIVSLQTPGIIY